MIWLFLRDRVLQVPEGKNVQVRGDAVFVLDHDGRSLGQYDAKSVLLYTENERLATLFEHEDMEPEGRPRRRRSVSTRSSK